MLVSKKWAPLGSVVTVEGFYTPIRKYGNMSYDSSRNAGIEKNEEIEITPQMIEAGQIALVNWEASSDPYSANCVASVYRAMAKARETQTRTAKE